MKIVITGNLGYVGSWVTRELRASYPDGSLVGVDMGYFAHCVTDVASLPEVLLDAQFMADVRRFPTEVLRGADAVVHLAAVSNDPMGHAYEEVTRQVNYVAAVALAREAKAAGVGAFVFASSCSVYGAADDRPRTERSALNPLTTYARSKILAEEALRELAGPTFRVSCLRFATACGMSDRLRLDLVLNDFVASAMSTGRITVLSDGTPWRPLINVADMARAIDWAVGRDADAGGDFLVVNAGSDSWNYQVHELASAVARAVPGTEVSINSHAPPDKRSYRVDFSLFASLAPRHQPRATLTDTIVELRRGLERMGFSNPDFRSSSLIRLQALAELGARGLLGPSLEWTNVPARSGPVFDPRPDCTEVTARA
jgi:nucleoside-diphosphate-sugar epimerase